LLLERNHGFEMTVTRYASAFAAALGFCLIAAGPAFAMAAAGAAGGGASSTTCRRARSMTQGAMAV